MVFINFIKSGVKNPHTYYIWGTLNLVFSILLKNTLNIGEGKFLFILGILVIIAGLLMDLGKNRVDSIDDDLLDSKISNIKASYLKNVIRNIYSFYENYFVEGEYLCKFYKRSGRVLIFFVKTEKEAIEYKEWFLLNNNENKIISINNNRVVKLFKQEIEEFKYKKITKIQTLVIDPIIVFFRQPSIYNISIKIILILSILTTGIMSGYYYITKSHSFTGEEGLNTINTILNTSSSFIYSLLILTGVIIVISGIFSIKNNLKDYYSSEYTHKRSLGKQLLKIAFIPICLNLLINPSIISVLDLIQTNGYFL